MPPDEATWSDLALWIATERDDFDQIELHLPALTNVRLQSCVDGVTDEQTQNGGANQDPLNGLADKDMTSQVPTGSKSHRNVDDISRSPKREQESEHT